MNKVITFLSSFFIMGMMHAQTIDIAARSQDIDLFDTTYTPIAYTYDANFEAAQFISNTFQIPANGLYSNHWDTLNIRSQTLEIPFYADQIRIELVQNTNNAFVFPCGGELAQKYGTVRREFHPGIDFNVLLGSPIVACFDGVVRLAKHCQEYGNTIIIRHYNGLETVYAHIGDFTVKAGQTVKAGAPIGTAGKSGNVTEPTLHFETRFMNHYFDPELMLNIETRSLEENSLIIHTSDITTIPIPEGEIPDKLKIMEDYFYQKKLKEETVVNDITPTLADGSVTPTLDSNNVGSNGKIALQEAVSTVPDSASQTATEVAEQAIEHATETIEKADKPTTDAPEAIYHEVKPGETLYRISVKYKVTAQQIIELNQLQGDGSNISIGQKLRVR